MYNILYINSCVRPESRTDRLARCVIKHMNGKVSELKLDKENIEPLTNKTLRERTEYLSRGDFSLPVLRYAKQFALADIIVVSAPYWDLSFPSALKVYFEAVNAVGITFHYINGRPESLCRAKKLVYVSTAGGKIFEPNMGLEYVSALAKVFYGISDIEYIKAEMLDADGADAEKILRDAKAKYGL